MSEGKIEAQDVLIDLIALGSRVEALEKRIDAADKNIDESYNSGNAIFDAHLKRIAEAERALNEIFGFLWPVVEKVLPGMREDMARFDEILWGPVKPEDDGNSELKKDGLPDQT